MILKNLTPEFVQSLSLEDRMDLAGEKGVNGRFIQEEGAVDIMCLTEPITILDTEHATVSVKFYSNNEPHIHIDRIKTLSAGSMKAAISGMREVLKKFNAMGYDKVYTLLHTGDTKSDKLISMIGFKPIIYYADPVGRKFTKYEMRTN